MHDEVAIPTPSESDQQAFRIPADSAPAPPRAQAAVELEESEAEKLNHLEVSSLGNPVGQSQPAKRNTAATTSNSAPNPALLSSNSLAPSPERTPPVQRRMFCRSFTRAKARILSRRTADFSLSKKQFVFHVSSFFSASLVSTLSRLSTLHPRWGSGGRVNPQPLQ